MERKPTDYTTENYCKLPKKFVKNLSQTFFMPVKTYSTFSSYCVKILFHHCAYSTKVFNLFLYFCVTQRQTTNNFCCAHCTNTMSHSPRLKTRRHPLPSHLSPA